MRRKSGIGAGVALVLAYAVFLTCYASARLLTAVPLPAGMAINAMDAEFSRAFVVVAGLGQVLRHGS